MIRPFPGARRAAFFLVAIALAVPARAQTQSPVYIDDAPRAWELFRLAREQAVSNTGEAIRIYQELLDTYGENVIPRHEATTDEFVSVRTRVLADLRNNAGLLDRYRLMQQAEAQRLLATNEIDWLLRTRLLTEAGLEALLRAGQEALEAAQFLVAIDAYERAIGHPGLTSDRAAHCWYGIGLAAHYLGRADRAREAIQRLDELGGDAEPFRREVAHLVAAGTGAEVVRGTSPLDRAEVSDLDELVAQTIWSVDMDASLLRRRHNPEPEAADGPSANYDRRRRDGDLTTVAATIAGSSVYINEGLRVLALDRFTGRSVWPQPYEDQPPPAIEHDKSQVGDLNVIAVDGDALVTLTGHAFADTRSTSGRVVCLDRRTGELRWAVGFDRLGDEREYEGLFPHGAPVIAEGAAYVLARKVSAQMLTGCYVVALDLATGDLRWVRHIASSGSRTKTARPFSSLVHDDGELFVATAVGAIACLEASNGDTRWLRRYSVPVHIRGRTRQPWEIGGPVLAGDHVVAITPDQRRITVLDRATGDTLETHEAWTGDQWNSPAYLLATDAMVYAIGSEIRAFSVDNLKRPRWQLPAARASLVDEVGLDGPEGAEGKRTRLSSEADAPTIVGRVQLVTGALVVPTTDGVLLVDDETGRVNHTLAVSVGGNPVASGAQLLLASGDTLEAYMSLSRAEQMLRERIAAAHEDADPALSLLQLGMRVGNLSLALEGADLSLRAIERIPRTGEAESARAELFNMLLEIHHRGIAAADDEREALYGMIGAVAATTDQRVEYLLAYGDGLAERTPGRAVETYQAVLSDPVLRATVRSESGLLRPAALWACERLGALLERVGAGAYEPLAHFARESYRHLLEDPTADDGALVALAGEFPYADAAGDAALRAARMQRERGETRAALATLATQYHLAPGAPRAARLLGAFIETCVDDERPTQAIRVLTSVGGERRVALEGEEGEPDAGAWLARLAPTHDDARRPRVRELDRPLETPARQLEGRLLNPPPAARRLRPSDRALLLAAKDDGLNDLRMITAETLEPTWTAEIEGSGVSLLHFDRDELLLGIGDRTDDPRIVAIDTSTGRREWTTPRLEDHLPAPLGSGRVIEDQMPNGNPFEPRQVLPLVGDEAVFLVRRTGGVAAFDRAHGGVLWSTPRTLGQVHEAIDSGFGIALVGMEEGPGADAPTPRLVVLDSRTGRIVHRTAPSRGGVLWVAADALGTLLCATRYELEAIDLLSGRRRWTNVAFDAIEARDGWSGLRDFIIESRGSNLHSVNAEDGRLSEPFDSAVRGNWERDALQDVVVTGDRILAHYRDRIVRYDLAGNVRGADIIAENRDFKWLLEGEDRLVVVSQHDTRQVPVDESGERQTQRTYHVYVLSDSCKLEGEIIALEPLKKRLDDAALMDGWLLLSTDAETWAVRLSLSD